MSEFLETTFMALDGERNSAYQVKIVYLQGN